MARLLGSEPPRLEDVEARSGGLPARADEGAAGARSSVNREPRAPGVSLLPGSLVVSSPSRIPRVHLAEVQSWFGRDFLVPLHHESGPSLQPTLVWREQHGGRKYPTYLPTYKGPMVISEARWRKVRQPGGILLSCISRKHRPGFKAPLGTTFLDVDIDQCFPAILAALSGDRKLAQACQEDLHQVSGDVLAPGLDPAKRRAIGKLFNLSAVGGITATGWAFHLQDHGLSVTQEEAQRMLESWWAGFPEARDFRDRWARAHRAAAKKGDPLWIHLPGERSFHFAPGGVLGDSKGGYIVKTGTPAQRLDAAVRTTLSAVFRGIEGLLLDRALQLAFPLRREGVRLVLPVYDGALFQVPENTAAALSEEVRAGFAQALAEAGIAARVSTAWRATWA